VAYGLIFLLGQRIRKRVADKPEISRKFIHFSGGLLSLSFPFYFKWHWTVLALALGFCLILLVLKQKKHLGSLFDIERKTGGAIYFPLAIYLIFLMAHNKPVFYFISILVMTVSDALAALIGGRYGKLKFNVQGSLKSLEGSVVFFFITFLCIHLPLLLLTSLNRLDSVIIAFIISVLVTSFEAISSRGLDNLVVPFGTYFILMKMTNLPHAGVVKSLYILLVVIILTVSFSFWLRLFTISGLIALMLLNYAAFALCNFYWFLPLLLAQIYYYLLMRNFTAYEGIEKVKKQQVSVIFSLGLLPTLFIFIANARGGDMFFYLSYLTSITAQMAIASNYFFLNYLSKPLKTRGFFKKHRKLLEIICTLSATLLIAALPVLLSFRKYLADSYWVISHMILIIMIGTWGAYMLNFAMNKYYRQVKEDIFEYIRRLIAVAVAAGLVLIMQMLYFLMCY
jgi:phytol kinase